MKNFFPVLCFCAFLGFYVSSYGNLLQSKTEEPKVIFAYFSGYRCPPCMKFKIDYLDNFKNTYRTKYKGRVEFREYMIDMPIDLTDRNSPEYKTAQKTAAQNSAMLGATGKMYGVKWLGSIPFAIIGKTVFDSSSDDRELSKENVEKAIDKALANNETTKLALKLSGRAEDYAGISEAARAGDYLAVKSFLDNGTDVNESEIIDGKPNGYTALIAAAFIGDADIVGLLLSQPDIHVNAESSWGSTALSTAAMFGWQEVVETLLAKGADIYAGENAILSAAKGTDRPMVQLLKKHGGDVNEPLKDGTTILMYFVAKRDDGKGGAATKVAIKSAGVLIDEGADVNATAKIKNADGTTTVTTVLQLAKSDAMKNFLISKGAK